MHKIGQDSVGVGVGVVIRRGDHWLLYRRSRPPEANTWGLVGGKIDMMEYSLDAARREAQEETGLTLGQLHFLGIWEQPFPQEGHHWISLMYYTDTFEGEPQITEPDKMPEFGWFLPKDFPQPLSAWVKGAETLMRSKLLLSLS